MAAARAALEDSGSPVPVSVVTQVLFTFTLKRNCGAAVTSINPAGGKASLLPELAPLWASLPASLPPASTATLVIPGLGPNPSWLQCPGFPGAAGWAWAEAMAAPAARAPSFIHSFFPSFLHPVPSRGGTLFITASPVGKLRLGEGP